MNLIDRRPWHFIALLIASLFVLHLSTISYQSYFSDEVEELHFALGDFWTSVFMPDSMPPLFTLSLRSWLALFGDSVDARWMSALLGMISTLAVYLFVRSLADAKVGLATAAFFAFSPLQLYYAQLVRGYALMTCLSICCIGFFLLAMKTSKPRFLVGFTLFAIIGMYAHYYFAMIPISLFVAWLYRKQWDQFPKIAVCYVAMFILTCPVLLFLVEDFKYQHDLRDPRTLSLPAIVYTFFSYFSGYALGPSQRELSLIDSAAAFRSAAPWLVAVALFAIPLFLRGLEGLKRKELVVPLLSVLTVPLFLIGVAGFFMGITYNVRFVAWFAFPLSVVLGFAYVNEDNRRIPKWFFACGVGLFAIFTCANLNRVFNPRYQFEDTRALANYLIENRSGSESVYVVSDYMLQPLAHYLSGHGELSGADQNFFELPQPGTRSRVIKDTESLGEAMNVVEANSGGKRSWLVYSRPFHGDPHGLILQEFTRRGASLSHRFAGIDLYLVPVQP
jgi:uncharacterized membrane protein